MNIQEEIDKLKQQKQEIADAIADNIERKKRLDATIKKLEKMFGKAQELLEDSPVIEPTKVLGPMVLGPMDQPITLHKTPSEHLPNKTLDLRDGSYY